MGTARWAFNETVKYLQDSKVKASWLAIKTGIIQNLPEWASKTPYQVRSNAIKDAVIAVQNAKKKYKKTKQIQKVKFRSKRTKKDSIYIPKSAVKKDSIYSTYLGKVFFTESLPEIEFDCRLIQDHGKFYLCVPVKKSMLIPENQRINMVALDPGVRAFQAFYSPEVCGTVGESDFGRIYRLCYSLDNLYSRMSKAKCKQKRRMRKAAVRIRSKIKNLVDEIHHKVAYFLCSNFEVILLPTFETSQMVTKLNSKVARSMLTWAHYRFKRFLKHKAEEFGSVVVDVCEAYTSKTCSACGKLQNIGSKKVMRCSCGVELPRDINGARGIFLRALVDTPSGLFDTVQCIC